MYISALDWSYAFSFRNEERFAAISAKHLSEDYSDDDEGAKSKPATPTVLQGRVLKVLMRDVGILYYRLQPSADDTSILSQYVDDGQDLDDLSDDYLKSDAEVRADLHVESGDPCFVLRHYTSPARAHSDLGEVTGCSGSYKEPDLETVQIDLRYGLLLDQRSDFLIQDRIPLELTRVLRTQDSRSRAFGIGGNHNLNIFPVGDRWPFTWIDIVHSDGGRSHFKRSNWGFGYWDARYTNRDGSGSPFSGATIEWAWPGWKLATGGKIYLFPDGRGIDRPEQAALISIQGYNGDRLILVRDAAGNLLRAHAPSGDELHFQYDSANRVIGAQHKDERFAYSYDATGHLARVTDAAQRETEYGYDAVGRMNRVSVNGATVCTFEFDGNDRVRSETLAGGRIYSFRYTLMNNGEVGEVDISDSAGPVRQLHLSPTEYSLDFPAWDSR